MYCLRVVIGSLIALLVSVVIAQSNYIGFDFTTLQTALHISVTRSSQCYLKPKPLLCLLLAYDKIEHIIQALNEKQVDAMLLDHYTASYYQARDQLKSLIIVTEFEFRRDVGVLFSNDRKDLADCLTFHRSNIWRLVQTNTATFKVILLLF